MFTKKRIIITIIGVIFVSFAIFIGKGIIDYIEYRNIAKSVSAMPWQDGGSVGFYNPMCIIEDPLEPTTCHTCLKCTALLLSACAAVEEIDFSGQLGGTVACPVKGFAYRGGGSKPTVGGNMIIGGSSPIQPWVIGVPGASASRIQKLVKWFNNYIIAGFKNN